MLDRLHDEITSGEEQVKQGDLFAVSQEEASKALTRVAARAGEEASP